jgi:hypothetical protein
MLKRADSHRSIATECRLSKEVVTIIQVSNSIESLGLLISSVSVVIGEEWCRLYYRTRHYSRPTLIPQMRDGMKVV